MSLEVEFAVGETTPAPVSADSAWVMREARSNSHRPVLSGAGGCLEAAAPAVVRGEFGKHRSPEARPTMSRRAIPEPASQSPPQNDPAHVERKGQDRSDQGIDAVAALVRLLFRHPGLPRSRPGGVGAIRCDVAFPYLRR